MRDVAKAAGVSPMTVSHALKPGGVVTARTRAVVQQAAEQLGYVYDGTAQTFRTQRSGFLALTVPSIDNASFAATHKAPIRAISETGLQLLLGVTGYDVFEEERLILQLLARRPEAIIVTGGTHTDKTRHLLRSVSGRSMP